MQHHGLNSMLTALSTAHRMHITEQGLSTSCGSQKHLGRGSTSANVLTLQFSAWLAHAAGAQQKPLHFPLNTPPVY